MREHLFPKWETPSGVRAFDTSIADSRNLSVDEEQQNTVTIQKIRLPAGNYKKIWSVDSLKNSSM